jgi:hypothetical protein
MKNKNLRAMIAQKTHQSGNAVDVVILNNDELAYAMGGLSDPCPNLTSCGSYSKCNGNCSVKIVV